MKKYTVILIFTAFALALSSCSSASDPTDGEETTGDGPLAIIEDYVERVSEGQISQVMAMFAEDASYETLDQGVISGTDALTSFCEYTAALNTELSLGDCSVDDLNVTCSVEENNDLWRAAGLGTLNYTSVVFTITPEDKIGGIVAIQDAEDTIAFNEIHQAFASSVMENHPEEAAQLYGSGDTLIHTRENAITAVQMMREWQPLWVVARTTTLFNAGEVEPILAFYATDIEIIFITGATDPWNGLDEARDFLEYHAYMDSHMNVTGCEYDGENRVDCTMTFTDNWIEAAGLPTYVFPGLKYEFNEQGEVRRIATRVDAATASALQLVILEYVPFVNNNYPEEAEIILDPINNFNFEYNLEAAEIQYRLILEWKESEGS